MTNLPSKQLEPCGLNDESSLSRPLPLPRPLARAAEPAADPESLDLVCFSHLRWDFVYQRPQHLLTRFARKQRVFYVEEPVDAGRGLAHLRSDPRQDGLTIVTPHLPAGMSEDAANRLLERLLTGFFTERQIRDYVFWYYTPMARAFTHRFQPVGVIYDCMDELSHFKDASPELIPREAELLRLADLVFTGGYSLYEAKRRKHGQIYPFPSSIDRAHFAAARTATEAADQAQIPRPRIGFCGVIDERMDLELIDGIARARPDWQLVMIGPVVKIDSRTLPCRPNIHYLGGRAYADLPSYLAGWDVAMLPFAHNDSTRFISPTKTPEYLAAGLPVVSTSIRDVVRPYGQQRLVHIADTVVDFVRSLEECLHGSWDREAWRRQVDAFLAGNSWDETWERMSHLLRIAIAERAESPARHALPLE
jgi:UDP-galactopyranose mutase